MIEGALGLSIDSAREIVDKHADNPCPQCRGRRCWMLEWAIKLVLLGGEQIRTGMRGAITIAARRIAEVHWPGDDGLCDPCWRSGCEPIQLALTWLAVIREPVTPPSLRATTVPDLAEARRLVKAHEGYGCSECGPEDCPAERRAMVALFDAVAERWPGAPKTVDDLSRVAEEMLGD